MTDEGRGRIMTGPYLPLYTYLRNRYADTVVLTFAEIGDLLGFTLPDGAAGSQEWWTRPEPTASGPRYEDAWMLAQRTAKPNLPARHVAFERVP